MALPKQPAPHPICGRPRTALTPVMDCPNAHTEQLSYLRCGEPLAVVHFGYSCDTVGGSDQHSKAHAGVLCQGSLTVGGHSV
jgi:hypothetical protein